jgi:hypothetical protein
MKLLLVSQANRRRILIWSIEELSSNLASEVPEWLKV